MGIGGGGLRESVDVLTIVSVVLAADGRAGNEGGMGDDDRYVSVED